jgi:hypothetical protein
MNTSVFLDFAQRDAFFVYYEIYIDLCRIMSIRYARPLMLRPWLTADPMVHIHVRDLTFMTPFDVYYGQVIPMGHVRVSNEAYKVSRI